ncbi:uncharacterized protein MYCFIDRAFT_26081 [Pseudocercospora fijiensis CIRAD86]|uniref:Phenylacetaldoxime dehydratase n=1 Tax=Pseudocercospora fijiensis (strain CIRAD86) TaxID=383855 RepID=N1Q9B6_PSEFD|nr:uncharacterized protein MYCFIDRAFT_26081 [Pseudocercospora fijiensis CIRAD86]EME89490.1 hypothetical protein MYCFIDRAFT_26081 [Pseudocercospora fijiensis CIRAD86]
MGSIGEPEQRTYPLKQPKNHQVPVPRWSLKLPPSVDRIYTIYVGAQCHRGNTAARERAEKVIEDILNSNSTPPIIDTFRVTHGFDLVDSRVWVAYWTSKEGYHAALAQLKLTDLWTGLGQDKADVGLWIEHFAAPVERLETNYARLDHKPGLAQLPNTEQPPHNLTAYWGAGRDRIPASAHDLFPTPKAIKTPSPPPQGFNQRLTGTNYDNMCHIRSGQWWEQCNETERLAYEQNLQKTLMTGMQYLWDHPLETGTLGLRFLQNLNSQGDLIKETCACGFHKNWADLEKWASRHASHLAIFNGSMRHAKMFGEERKFMTWHEVWILKEGECGFEYVNCHPKTGVIGWVEMEREDL